MPGASSPIGTSRDSCPCWARRAAATATKGLPALAVWKGRSISPKENLTPGAMMSTCGAGRSGRRFATILCNLGRREVSNQCWRDSEGLMSPPLSTRRL